MEIKFGHGALCDRYEQQANRQGFTLGDKEELFDKVKYSYNFLWVHGYLTDSQADTICKKIQKQIIKNLKPLKSI